MILRGAWGNELSAIVAGGPPNRPLPGPAAAGAAPAGANAPLALVDQYVGNLRQYRAIAMDVGDQDRLRTDTARLHEGLDRYGIAKCCRSSARACASR